MGINSTEVSYGFGQMGSVFQNQAFPVWPPKDHVIVAIQFMASNTPTVLETETLNGAGPQFITHQDDEIAADGGPDANFVGVTFAEASGAGTVATGVIPLTDDARNGAIKPGQIVLIGDDATEGIDNGITVDTAAGHIDPIYQGPNKQWVEVVSLASNNTTLTVKAIGKATLANIGSIDGDNRLYFLDPFHGGGGTTTEGTKFPGGITIYGRWTKVVPEADPNGGIICYFGK